MSGRRKGRGNGNAQVSTATAAPAPRTTIEAIANRLREDILSGVFPPGSKLRIEELRRRYGGGISTVREALSRLMSESLVVSEEQRGFRTAPMSIKDLHDISEMRKLLECQALTRSIETGDMDWETRVVAAYHRLSRIEEQIRKQGYSSELAQQWSAANEEYHDALVSACGNTWLMKIRKILHNQSYRYIRFSLVNAGASRDVHEEHRAIFHAAMARDAERACALIRQHIDNTVNVIVKMLDGQLEEHQPDGNATR